MAISSEFYPASDCRNFGVEYVDELQFWKEKLHSALIFDEEAVGLIQTFHLCVDTGKEAVAEICQLPGISADVASCVRSLEGQFIENKYQLVQYLERLLGLQLQKEQTDIILKSVRPADRIINFNFLLWASSEIEEPYYILIYILYEDGGILYYVISDTVDGVSPDNWIPNKTTWDTVLEDMYDPGYLALKGSKGFFEAAKGKILEKFPEKFAHP